MSDERFGGAAKVGTSLLFPLEQYLKKAIIPRMPRCVETYHLTLLTLVWSAAVIVFSYAASFDIRWLWAVSSIIVLQYVSDLFDGELGRYRNTGLVKWGYYMDHFLDYIFLSALLIGYGFVFPNGFNVQLFCLFVVLVSFMINSFLAFSVSNEFKIFYFGIGPSEIRMLFIFANILMIAFGTAYVDNLLPVVTGVALVCLACVVYMTQRALWRKDMGQR